MKPVARPAFVSVFVVAGFLAAGGAACADDSMIVSSGAVVPPPAPAGDSRILGVIPNYQTVSDPNADVRPMTAKEKWVLFARSTNDPFVLGNVILGASLSHARQGPPAYGGGAAGFSQRLGAAYADLQIQGMLTGAAFAQVFHQDPRYFRRGPGSSVMSRIAYSVSRIALTRSDDGRTVTNWSFLLGTGAAIGISNAYYPDSSRNGSTMLSRVGTNLVGSALGNLLPEFWPDIQNKLFRRHRPQLAVKNIDRAD